MGAVGDMLSAVGGRLLITLLVGRLRLRCARSLSQVYCSGTECLAALARVVAGEANGQWARSAKRAQRRVPCQGP
ncbi:hypothetical protein CBM2634_B10058 [Cupriavidus taiwanensis]|uniref:Uncharacterized protein n=1 Tax=Cupriavidus taiwanensis TaxID=164546 RepID=A0A375J344_9BURK|nr:hypothetical protein CBM2634_B10058 [Cupriavidus taiwanensis]